ncbi:MAG: serine hydrolase [Saprospiraceae bacterium]
MRYFFLLISLSFFLSAQAQSYYFPPLAGDEWETIDPLSIGWCQDKVDSLVRFVGERNSKSFIILKDGKILVEQYYGNFQQASLWYWASASKSLMGMLVGRAQEEGYLNIEVPTSTYLGTGWTNTTAEQELQITVRSQLSMASGLDDSLEPTGATDNCFEPACFQYLADPYSRWAYHNSAYRILQDVLEMATGQSKLNYTRSLIGDRIGMKGFWLDYIYYSTARDMARFGLLALNKGVWSADTILHDQAYYQAMISSSQQENPSYGYLWWLNGQSAFQLPGIQLKINRYLIPEAPADLFAALGKNDQKIYVVPSQGLVVIRQGDAAGGITLTSSSFDLELWERLEDMSCTVNTKNDRRTVPFSIRPNPARDFLWLQTEEAIDVVNIYNLQGKLVFRQLSPGPQQAISINELPGGTYFVQIRTKDGLGTKKIVKLY